MDIVFDSGGGDGDLVLRGLVDPRLFVSAEVGEGRHIVTGLRDDRCRLRRGRTLATQGRRRGLLAESILGGYDNE